MMKGYLVRWSPAVILMGIIFIASSTPGSDLPDFGALNFLVMKLGHMTGYALLGAAYLHGLSHGRPVTRNQCIAAGILVILYALTDEWHQNFTADRTPAIRDVCIDTAGGILGILILRFIRAKFMDSRDRA